MGTELFSLLRDVLKVPVGESVKMYLDSQDGRGYVGVLYSPGDGQPLRFCDLWEVDLSTLPAVLRPTIKPTKRKREPRG